MHLAIHTNRNGDDMTRLNLDNYRQTLPHPDGGTYTWIDTAAAERDHGRTAVMMALGEDRRRAAAANR